VYQHFLGGPDMADATIHESETITQAEVAAQRSRKGFWALIVTQFRGAFSDNVLRNLLVSMVVGTGIARSERETFVCAVTFIFSVLLLLLSMPGQFVRVDALPVPGTGKLDLRAINTIAISQTAEAAPA
jgi:hypothetical protein